MAGRDEMGRRAETKLTYDDYLLFPDDGRRHELIDGEHHVTPSPVARHQRILRRLATAIDRWLDDHPAGEMFFAPFDVILSDFDVVEPDLLFVSAARSAQVRSRGVFGAPDLVVEILSPGTRRTDEAVKRQLYERCGVIEYWVIDPELNVATVFSRAGAGGRFGRAVELSKERGDLLTTALLPGWTMPLAKLLA
jgi:Uma2 family endonuclease